MSSAEKSDIPRDCIWTTAWAYLTYSLLHVGAGHMTFNLVLQLGIGLGLEMVHGSISVMILYILGVRECVNLDHAFIANSGVGRVSLLLLL